MNLPMNNKITIIKPSICVCYIKIDGNIVQLKGVFRGKTYLNIPPGLHKINIGIEISDDSHIGMDHGYIHWSDIEWAWENNKEIMIDNDTTIKIKRKWHLLHHITCEAKIL